jgi:ribosomal protein L28
MRLVRAQQRQPLQGGDMRVEKGKLTKRGQQWILVRENGTKKYMYVSNETLRILSQITGKRAAMLKRLANS